MTITSFQPVDKYSPIPLNFQVECIIQSSIRNSDLKPTDLISETCLRLEFPPALASKDVVRLLEIRLGAPLMLTRLAANSPQTPGGGM
ncbi:MAG: hypothetical protein ACK2TX_02630 [Anaerolineales bacterium]